MQFVESDSAGEHVTVGEHKWAGYRCQSRVVRAVHPSLAPVLLVGGAFQRKEDWGRIEEGLLEHADVVTIDLPGWGSADLLPDHYGVDYLADALNHVLDELNLAGLNVLSGSYGTAIVYRLAQRHPGRVARMMLVGTMVAIPDHYRDDFHRTLELLTAGRIDDFAQTALGIVFSRDPAATIPTSKVIHRILKRRIDKATAEEIAKYGANTRRLLNLPMVDTSSPPVQPTLVVTGEYDTFTTPTMCRELAATCVDSQFTTVRDADHMVHLERSAEIVDLMLRFFADGPISDLPYCNHIERVCGPLVA